VVNLLNHESKFHGSPLIRVGGLYERVF
jgi:hypothetical protein